MKDIFDFKRFTKYYAYDFKRLVSGYGPNLLFYSCFPVVLSLLVGLYGIVLGHNHAWVSPSPEARIGVMVLIILILIITMPSRIYGRLTEKKAGSSWLLLPSSRAEKFITMIINCFVLVPAFFFVVYFFADWLVCLLDTTCGPAIINTSNLSVFNIDGFESDGLHILKSNYVALLYTLLVWAIAPFFLGTFLFKKNKQPILTIISLFVLQMVVVSILVFAGRHGAFDGLESLMERVEDVAVDDMESAVGYLASGINWAINIISLIWLGGLGVASWFRIKSLKH